MPPLADLALLPPEARGAAWRRLAAGPPLDVAAVDAALAGWGPEDRPAPSSCFARVEAQAPQGPHDQPEPRWRGWRTPPAWPWAVSRSADLDLDGLDAAGLASFGDALWPAHLRSLAVRASSPQAAALADLLQHPALIGLSRVHLTLWGTDPAQVAAALAVLPALDHLGLVGARLTDGALRTRSLTLRSCSFGEGGLGAWAGAFDGLEALTLASTGLDDRAAAGFRDHRSPRRLRSLVLREDPGAPGRSEVLLRLLKGGWLDGLEHLEVAWLGLRGATLAAVLDRADLGSLRTLILEDAGSSAEDRARIAARLPGLTALRVDGETLRGGSFAPPALVARPRPPGLPPPIRGDRR